MTIFPCLSEAALVIRGVTTGTVVEATLMVSACLWPGTFEKVACALLWIKLDGDPHAKWICLAAQPLHVAQWPLSDAAESGVW